MRRGADAGAPDFGADPGAGGPPRAAILTAVAVGVAAIGGLLALAAARERPPRVAVAAAPAPKAGSAECRALLGALPQRLGDYRRATIADPAPDGAAAWQAEADEQPVVLRCGLRRPADFAAGSPVQFVDGVQWFETSAAGRPPGPADGTAWCAVDRPVYVGLSLPPGPGPAPIQQLSDVIAHTLSAVPVEPARGGG